CHKYITSPFTF
nr:immunoglobulin light chain junction region [Macaca mulatta]